MLPRGEKTDLRTNCTNNHAYKLTKMGFNHLKHSPTSQPNGSEQVKELDFPGTPPCSTNCPRNDMVDGCLWWLMMAGYIMVNSWSILMGYPMVSLCIPPKTSQTNECQVVPSCCRGLDPKNSQQVLVPPGHTHCVYILLSISHWLSLTYIST